MRCPLSNAGWLWYDEVVISGAVCNANLDKKRNEMTSSTYGLSLLELDV